VRVLGPEPRGDPMNDTEWMAVADDRPWSVIIEALNRDRQGRILSEPFEEAFSRAAVLLVAGFLMRLGHDRQFVLDLFDSSDDWSIEASARRVDGKVVLTVGVDFGDDRSVAVTGKLTAGRVTHEMFLSEGWSES
jgi:hypothetical protein